MRAALGIVLLAAGCAGRPAPAPKRACAGWGQLASERRELAAQPVPAELVGATIVAVEVRGSRSVPAELVLVGLEQGVGDPVDPGVLAADLRRVWALEAFSAVDAELAPAAGGAELRWVVTERPLVGRVRVEAWRPLRRLQAMAGGIHDPVRVARLAEAVRTQLEQDGHLRAAVRSGARRAGDRIDLCVAVEPGPKFAIDRVEFPGSRRIGAAELRATLRTREGQVNATGGVWRPDLFDQDLIYLQALYYDRGLIDARIGAPVVRIDGARHRVTVRIPVHEGAVFRLGKLAVTGVPEEAAAALLRPLASGQVFNRSLIGKVEERMRAWLRARGAKDPDVQPATAIDAGRRTIDISFALENR